MKIIWLLIGGEDELAYRGEIYFARIAKYFSPVLRNVFRPYCEIYFGRIKKYISPGNETFFARVKKHFSPQN
jgi:hypothetical protein